MSWTKLEELTGITNRKEQIDYTEYFLSTQRKQGYLLSDKENQIVKRQFGDQVHYKNIENIIEEKKKTKTKEEFVEWRNSVTDKYSFTRKIPMNWKEQEEWGQKEFAKEEEGLKMVNPDFK